jgi:hypothetical protein
LAELSFLDEGADSSLCLASCNITVEYYVRGCTWRSVILYVIITLLSTHYVVYHVHFKVVR